MGSYHDSGAISVRFFVVTPSAIFVSHNLYPVGISRLSNLNVPCLSSNARKHPVWPSGNGQPSFLTHSELSICRNRRHGKGSGTFVIHPEHTRVSDISAIRHKYISNFCEKYYIRSTVCIPSIYRPLLSVCAAARVIATRCGVSTI